jgi:hypothetical protein
MPLASFQTLDQARSTRNVQKFESRCLATRNLVDINKLWYRKSVSSPGAHLRPDSEKIKLRWEILKLKAEFRSLSHPLRQPALWLGIAGLILSIGVNIIQWNRKAAAEQESQIKHDRLDLETAKLEDRRTQLDKDIAQKEHAAQEAQALLLEQQKTLDKTKADLSELSQKLSLAKNKELQASTERLQQLRTEAAQAIETLEKPLPPQRTHDFETARRQEQAGFKALAAGDIDEARKDFQASEDAANGYHYVYELARELRPAAISDPAKKRAALQKILDLYLGGAPTDVVAKIREMVK